MFVVSRGVFVVLVAASALTSRAALVIDTFEQGYFKATITGEGGKDHLATGLDRAKCFAGHRNTYYAVNSNPLLYTTTFEVGLGEARVSTPGPQDLSTETYYSYGTGFFEPMNMDISALPTIEVDLGTDPPDLFAEVWDVRVSDGTGHSAHNSAFGTRPGGILFLRAGFVGGQNVDWSDIDELVFRQRWNRQNTAPLNYWATEIRAVPEPGAALMLGFLAILVGLRRRVAPPKGDLLMDGQDKRDGRAVLSWLRRDCPVDAVLRTRTETLARSTSQA